MPYLFEYELQYQGIVFFLKKSSVRQFVVIFLQEYTDGQLHQKFVHNSSWQQKIKYSFV